MNHLPKKPNKSRMGAAIRAQRRNQEDAHRVIEQYTATQSKLPRRTNKIVDAHNKLKLTFLGGLEDVGEKNMAILEFRDEAIILDCGNNLGVDLPGVNYEINDISYLETIKHNIKAYIITHGHLDHIGGLRHTAPKYPAPIYCSRYTAGVIEKTFQDEMNGNKFVPDMATVDIDNHDLHKISRYFSVEFIRVTHAIPEPAAICIRTPVGMIVATGDFRLDPEPLDNLPSDKKRLKQLGDEGVLLLLSDSSYADAEGRTPAEHTLQTSFMDIITQANGRIFVAVFSSNINRIQMIINAAVEAGRKVALEGRSMMGYAEIAVRQGILKVPRSTIVSISQSANIPANQLLVLCTGGQGEPNAALQRMSEGSHKYVNLSRGDTVIISSSPIPGNEIRYDQLSNHLSKKGVRLFRHPTHELDGCGPLHVSGHAKRDELREMIAMIKPTFFIPVHGGALRRTYHAELGVQENVPRKNIFLPDNGDSLYVTANGIEDGETVPHGSLLVDQTGEVVSPIVIKDRLMLSEQGILSVILTIDTFSGRLLTSPDIISRGFIAMKDNEHLMRTLRYELRKVIAEQYKLTKSDRFKSEVRDFITHFMYEHTNRSPIVIPVINLVESNASAKIIHSNRKTQMANDWAAQEQKRFEQMRARLLGQDQRD